MKIFKTPLNNTQKQKVKSDLSFLKKILNYSKQKGFRVVVSGGYGLDGILGEITRSHNDLDLIIYWNKKRAETVEQTKKFIIKIFPQAQINIKPDIFYTEIDVNTKDFGANIYLVETINNPLKNINDIKKSDGKIKKNTEKDFPLPVKAKLLGINFEAQNPETHLKDILLKRKRLKKHPKHQQDIKNLREIVGKVI